ncbi:hypothetical protein F7725_004784 [Dissostichus mawsoni]|uniref:F5/8 type C domain-containing protein n=1 Tax=Dissostichus mawsoni TaxID=36200 RepID=A0A7J5XK21_DISMA|nr:hypothetical protein F7725_004784 [Dissostichus mawsoni]
MYWSKKRHINSIFQLLIKCLDVLLFGMANIHLCHCPYSAANLALDGMAESSTTFDSSHPPSNANDGSDETHQQIYRSCFVSQMQIDPWWRLDLGGLFDISTIELLRRTDSAAAKILTYVQSSL